MKDAQKKKFDFLFFVLFTIFIVAFAAGCFVWDKYFSYFNYLPHPIPHKNVENLNEIRAAWGTFGDFMGGVLNPILSFLGLIALLFTIALQSKELELTREELRRAASSQEETEKLLAEQTKTQLKQQFEGTFFSLLGELNRVLDKLLLKNKNCNDRIESVFFILKQSFFAQLKSDDPSLENDDFLSETMNTFFKPEGRTHYAPAFNQYFLVLFQILKFVKDHQDHLDSDLYVGILKSLIHPDCYFFLAINCLLDEGSSAFALKGYKDLVEKYSMLELVDVSVDKNDLKDFMAFLIKKYDSRAFGNNRAYQELMAEESAN